MGSKRKRTAKEMANPDQAPQKKSKIEASSRHDIPKAAKGKLFLDKSPFKENLAREDHERERQLYKLLGSEDVEDRIKAADVIVSVLLDGDGVPTPVFKRHLEGRLFRGLASGNNAARVGFGYVLAELLGQLFGEKDLASTRYPELTFDKVLGMLIEKTQGPENMREGRDNLWGQLFGLQTFVQAGILFQDVARLEAVLGLLLDLGNKKLWLRSQSAFIVAQAIPKMDRGEVERTLEKVSQAGIAKSLEGLGIWLAAAEHFPKLELPKPWKHPLSSKSLQDVVAVLKSSDKEPPKDEEGAGGQQQRNASAQLHFAWDLVFHRLLKSKRRKTADFELFWDRVVDQVYFTKTASDHQKLLGFRLFQKAIKDGADQEIVLPGVFSKNLMARMVSLASNPGPRLHRAATLCLKAVERTVKENPALLVPVLQQLLGADGFFNLDERVRNSEDGIKPIETLLRSANASNVADVVDTLRTAALAADTGDQDSLRTLGEYLLRLATRASTEAASEDGTPVAARALQELARLAYHGKDGLYPSPKLTIQEAYRKHVLSAAAALLRGPEGFSSLYKLVLDIEPGGIDMSDDIRSQVGDALERLSELAERHGNAEGRPISQGLAVLHAVAILQLYSDAGPDGLTVLQDAKCCFEQLDNLENGAESNIAEVLVEVLLSMLAMPSSISKRASLVIFETLSPWMSKPALEHLTEVLNAQETASGYEALFSGLDEEAADEDDDIDMEDVDKILGDLVSEDDATDDTESGTSGSEAESTDDASSSDEEDQVNGKAEAKKNPNGTAENLEKVLMDTYKISHMLDVDNEAESSDDDADMTDSEMLELDNKLAAHMRLQAKSTKKQRQEAERGVVAFKHRVLDLLEVFVKKEAGSVNPLVVELFAPLLGLTRSTKDRSLSQKATRIIGEAQKILKKARKGAKRNIDADRFLAALEEVHEAAHDPTENKAFATAVSAASLSIAGVLFGVEGHGRVADVYRKTLDRRMKGLISVRTSFLFTDWGNWCQSVWANDKSAEVNAAADS